MLRALMRVAEGTYLEVRRTGQMKENSESDNTRAKEEELKK